jgi:16S rRNA (uracil1498-N3)-methyltransferase
MKQFLLPPWYAGEPAITLSGGDFRHVARVRRMREGDVLSAVDSRGALYEMRLERVGRTECEARLTPRPAAEGRGVGPTDGPRVTLLQCLPKGRKIDLIVRQATEAGVSRIVLLVSERVVAHPGEDDGRVARLQRVAREALQQSGTPVLPEIDGPRPFSFIEGEDQGTRLLFHETPLGADTAPLHALLSDRPRAVSLLVGPEGGLSEAEVARAQRAGFRAVHFDTGVLRVETAATFALGAVMTILQERNAWTPAQEK